MTNPHHPCLACVLPDCDEASPECGLRPAIRRYQRARDRGLPVTPEMRGAYGAAWMEIYGGKRAARMRARQGQMGAGAASERTGP